MSVLGPVAVVGGGTMGAGIAALACRCGVPTVLCDIDDAAVHAGVERVDAELDRRVGRGRMTAREALDARARLTASADLGAVAGVQLAIEAIPERLELKRELLARLGAIAPAAVLASNTSSIPIATLAEQAPDPARVLGLHFFNPPGAMPLVELVTTPRTDPRVVDAARSLAESLGKLVVAVADGPGFLVNRCARPYYLEALRLVETDAATPAQIDAVCEQEGGFPMGPFRLMDTIGIDVSLAVTRSMWEQSDAEPRWRPSPIQEQLVAAGRLGRKSGRGFHVYAGADGAAAAPAELPADHAALLLRIVAQLVNEAWFALDASVAAPADVDVAMTVGLGYPRGPLAWGRDLGLDTVVALLDRLAEDEDRARYRVAAGLRRAAADARPVA